METPGQVELDAHPAPEVRINDIILPNQTSYNGLYNVDDRAGRWPGASAAHQEHYL